MVARSRTARPSYSRAHSVPPRPIWVIERLSDVTGAECRIYVRSRSTVGRWPARNWKNLRAALNPPHREALHDKIVTVIAAQELTARTMVTRVRRPTHPDCLAAP